MKKFIAFVVLLCVIMISSTTSAELQPVQLYDQNVFTLTQKLQSVGIKIWNMKYQTTTYYPGYEANFGDNPNNRLAFLVNNDGAVAAMAIITRFENSDYPVYPTIRESLEVAGATLVMFGLTLEDIEKLDREISYYFLGAATFSPHATKYHKEFSAYSVQTGRLIVMELFVEEIRPELGTFGILMRAYA